MNQPAVRGERGGGVRGAFVWRGRRGGEMLEVADGLDDYDG